MSGLRLVTLAERPDLADALAEHNASAWPEFMLHDPVADALWRHLHAEFAAYQLILLDGEVIAAAANSAPLCWDGTDDGLPEGWDDQFRRSSPTSPPGAHRTRWGPSRSSSPRPVAAVGWPAG